VQQDMWKKKDKKKYQYGLALSGGGTRGFAHLGVLKALEEHNIRPDVISGVSAGAIVGVLFADGNKPEDILDFLTRNKLFQFLRFSIPRQGLVQMSGFERTLKEMLKTKKIEDLGIPMKIFAVNINTADYTCFEKGDIVSVVKASSSIPIVFSLRWKLTEIGTLMAESLTIYNTLSRKKELFRPLKPAFCGVIRLRAHGIWRWTPGACTSCHYLRPGVSIPAAPGL
jgi:hypothetical protein